MTGEQALLFGLFGAVFALLIWGRWRYDLVAFSALLVAVLAGLVPAERAFEGFGHPATIVVALVLVVSAGLTRSGAVGWITRQVADPDRGTGAHVALMGAVGGVLSAFMNNVAALALLMPVDVETARRAGRAAGRTLMPLSFATILGGMATLIGTPPNIIIATWRGEALGQPFGMFDFAPVGGIVALLGLGFVAAGGWRLIPDRAPAGPADPAEGLAPYVAELSVPEGAGPVGRTLADLEETAEAHEVGLIGLLRGGRRRLGGARRTPIRAGDALVIEAAAEAIEAFRAELGLALAEDGRQPAAEEGLAVVEVVVPVGARIAGRSAARLGLGWRQRAHLLGIARQGRRITGQVRRAVVEPGDVLLLLVPEGHAGEVAHWLGALPLAERGLAVADGRKAGLAAGLFAAAVAAASLGLADLPVALGAVVVGYVLTRILPLAELYDHVEWPVIVLLGAMIPLGSALEAAGGTDLIARGLLDLTAGLPPWVALAALMAVTMTLSDVLNNTATAIVAAPVGLAMAEAMAVSPDPFLMAVAVAASCAFLTPIGHKNNTLILGPGGYRFGDYWRLGLPLEVLVVAAGVPLILVVWPL